jgi:8-oxoguanine deaminase
MSLLIRNADWIITQTSGLGRLRHADIVTSGPAIAAIGPGAGDGWTTDGGGRHAVGGSAPGEVIDAQGMVVIPGLVNTHHHLFQTLTRNLPCAQDLPLFPWLMTLYEIWRELTVEAVETGALVGLGELLKTGCTTSADHHYVFPAGRGADGFIDAQVAAARRLGVRFHPCRGSMSLGRGAGGLPPDDVVQGEDEILADCERLAAAYHDPGPYSMCRLALAPCSPFSVTTALLERTARVARRLGLGLHTHLAETADEERFCLERHGLRPVAYLAGVDWLGKDVWFAHAVHLDDAEIELLGKTGTGVAHCAVSNMKLGSGVCRVSDLVRAGARVGLAVDGSASNDSSSMLGELRVAYLLRKLTQGGRGDSDSDSDSDSGGGGGSSAEEMLRLATLGGAAALGRDDIGRLDVGMAADFVLIDLTQLGFAGGRHDPVAAIVTCGDSHIVHTTVVNGRVVVRDGRLVGVDEREIARHANCVSDELIARAAARTGIDFRSATGVRRRGNGGEGA